MGVRAALLCWADDGCQRRAESATATASVERVMTREERLSQSRPADCPPNGGQNVLVVGEAVRVLCSDALIIDPNRKLTSSSCDEDRVEADGACDQRRHTGSAGTIISNLTITDRDNVHEALSCCSSEPAPTSGLSTIIHERRPGRDEQRRGSCKTEKHGHRCLVTVSGALFRKGLRPPSPAAPR